MKLIILAAGMGNRMGSQTENKPKCMVSYFGKPIIDYQLVTLSKCGIRDVVIVDGYKRDVLESYLSKSSVRFVSNVSFDSTNMVHSLFCAEPEMDDDLIISYGDIIYSTDVLKQLIVNNSPFVVAVDSQWRKLWSLRMDNPLDDAETMKIDKNGDILELGKKAKSYNDIQGQYIGLFKMARSILPKIREFYHSLDRSKLYDGQDFENMYMTSFIQLVINGLMPVKAEVINGGWLEFDNEKDLSVYELHCGVISNEYQIIGEVRGK